MRLRTHLLGAVLALSALTLLAPKGAIAANYSGQCSGVAAWSQSDGQGNVTISQSGACTIGSAVTASGSISISASGAISTQALTANGGNLTLSTSAGTLTTNSQTLTTASGYTSTISATGNITAGIINSGSTLTIKTTGGTVTTEALTSGGTGYLTINATGNIKTAAITSGSYVGEKTTGGTISSGDISSNQGTVDGDILLMATGNIGVGNIVTTAPGAGSVTGGVEIDANIGNATTTPFQIGGSTANGVSSIDTSNSTGGGTDPTFITGGLNITNGSSAATGGITISSMGDILVNSSGGRSGVIFLNAQMGTLVLPTNELNTDGSGSQGAGEIILQASKVTAVDGTIISASQTSTSGTAHAVTIAATTISVSGTTSGAGLAIHADGAGDGSYPGLAQLLPQGAISVTSNQNLPAGLLWTPSTTTFANAKPLTVSGTGNFTITASNGGNNEVVISAYPITFSNNNVTVQALGTGYHLIYLDYEGSYSGKNGLTFNGTGNVVIDASGVNSADNAGNIYVYTDQASISSPNFSMHADSKGSGQAGYIAFQPTAVSLSSATSDIFSTNGASGLLEFQPVYNSASGSASITTPSLTLTANTLQSNQAYGKVYFQTGSLTLGSGTLTQIYANGPTEGIGPGGYVDLSPGTISTLKLGTKAGDVQVLTNGGTSGGNGGEIYINTNGNITIDTLNGVGAAVIGTTGNYTGGNISLYAAPTFAVTSSLANAAIDVRGYGTGSGGTVLIQGNGTLSLGTGTGDLTLLAQNDGGTGNGGELNLGYLTTLNLDADINVAAGTGTNSGGNGGTINFHNIGTLNIGTVTLNAAAGTGADSTGVGGTITLDSQNTLALSGSYIASGGIDGPGGKLSVTHSTLSWTSSDTIIQTWAGRSVSNTGTFGGSATLNGVACQQFQTGYNWPTFYRDCVNTNPTATEQLPASVASALSGKLSSVKYSLYVMTEGTQFNTYFGTNEETNDGGGYTPDPTGTTIDTFIYENINNVAGVLTAFTVPGQLTEVTDHELGHVIDLNAGVNNSSGSKTYSTAITDDQNYLKTAGGGNPCLANGKGPFNGVVDTQTGAQFCNGATLNNPGGIYNGLNNAQIAQASSPSNLDLTPTIYGGFPGYIEPFAQSFAYQDYGYSLSYPAGYIDTTADGLMHNGYYSCIQAYAANLAGKSYTPIFSYSCK